VPYSHTTFQIIKALNVPNESELLSVVESLTVERVDSACFLTTMLQSQETQPNVAGYVAIAAYGSDDAAAFFYFCQGSKTL
jgi:hypothetical protein